MLILGKTVYRSSSGGGEGVSKTPKEIDLGTIEIQGEIPTHQELATALNQAQLINVTVDELPIFSVEFTKAQPV